MGAINIRCACEETRGSPKSDFLSLHRNLGILIVEYFLMRFTIKIQRSFIRKTLIVTAFLFQPIRRKSFLEAYWIFICDLSLRKSSEAKDKMHDFVRAINQSWKSLALSTHSCWSNSNFRHQISRTYTNAVAGLIRKN